MERTTVNDSVFHYIYWRFNGVWEGDKFKGFAMSICTMLSSRHFQAQVEIKCLVSACIRSVDWEWHLVHNALGIMHCWCRPVGIIHYGKKDTFRMRARWLTGQSEPDARGAQQENAQFLPNRNGELIHQVPIWVFRYVCFNRIGRSVESPFSFSLGRKLSN